MAKSTPLLVSIAILLVRINVSWCKDQEDVNPLVEAASAIMKEQNLQNIGSVVSNFMAEGGAEKIGDLLGHFSSEDGANLISGIGSLMGGGGNQGGINPALLGAALSMLGNAGGQESSRKKTEPGIDMGDVLSLVGNFMASQGANKEPGEGGIMDLLPTILSTISSFNSPAADDRAKSHSDHSSMLPPFLEKLHVYFDLFLHSEMGATIINFLGAEKVFNIFVDEGGRFDYSKFGDMIENLSFRRHWIRLASDRIMSLIKLLADPTIQKQYVQTAPFLINPFLQGQHFPKNAMLDLNRPSESLSAIANHVSKKYLGMKINSKMYVKPAVTYVQDLMKLYKNNDFLKNQREVSDKIADTVNLELIEPLLRVNRAYRFAKNVPACDKYVFCLVNEENQNEVDAFPDLKKTLYKGTSLVASWFLTSHTKTPFLDMYDVISGNERCKNYYVEKCNGFHIEEMKVTTEYVHSEL